MTCHAHSATGVYQYLEASGVLDTGDSASIAECRKLYWREYKRKWKAEKSKRETEFKVFLTDKEVDIIAAAACEHSLSRTSYIKHAALATAKRRYLVPNKEITNRIAHLLTLNVAFLQDLGERLPPDIADDLNSRMAALEHYVLTSLRDPQEIKQPEP